MRHSAFRDTISIHITGKNREKLFFPQGQEILPVHQFRHCNKGSASPVIPDMDGRLYEGEFCCRKLSFRKKIGPNYQHMNILITFLFKQIFYPKIVPGSSHAKRAM